MLKPEGLTSIIFHPSQSSGFGGGLVRKVDNFQVRLRIGVEILTRSVLVYRYSDVPSVIRCEHLPQSFLEQTRIDGPLNFDALSNIVAWIVFIEHLDQPNAELRLGQRKILDTVTMVVLLLHS